ncbi:MAG: type II toxin-antitoxin system RelE/ParE family toxin [Nitrospinae bacterium]|nr:type II toxin-antitoxin system RelE/ParE family toxin [Nitrospinota bacterium]
MIRDTRPISWVKAALKDYQKFPKGAQLEIRRALTVAAEGAKAENAKPMKGLGPGVFEIALKYRTDAYRVVYAVQIGEAIWVVHAFQKKSKTGIKTPKQDIDLIKKRTRETKELLK